MAEIKIQKKKRNSAGLWIFLILLLAFIAVLILDGLEVINTPNWIDNHENTVEQYDNPNNNLY